MRSSFLNGVVITLLSGMPVALSAQSSDSVSYSPCPLIGAYYPPPTVSKTSKSVTELKAKLTQTFDDLIKNGESEDFGAISPNTTSFSVVLFGGSAEFEDDPVFFEYHYTSPADYSSANTNLTSTTKFPIGDLTMIFTVYAWLVKQGENWETPITEYLPELLHVHGPLTVSWRDVTIGSLAAQMSGLSRTSGACVIDEPCSVSAFLKDFATKAPLFQPDTTPIVSYAAFQLLVFAMQRGNGHNTTWASILDETLLQPLNMTTSSLLSSDSEDVFLIDGLNKSQIGEPGALSLVSSIEDLARAGHSILSSALLSPAVTRRWLHPNTDTSNLRNGVGRPWEVYRAGSTAISPVLDVMTKSGSLGQYASYFGLTTDFNTGFAILSHDSSVADRKLDLNVYADIVSESLVYFQEFAAEELAERYVGTYASGERDMAVLNITDNGPGLEVQELVIDAVDMKNHTAIKLGISPSDLDFRLYPTNVQDESMHQFVAVFQDKSAPVDAGTPTCITWQEVGSSAGVEVRVLFLLEEGNAVTMVLPQENAALNRTQS